jgi:hypothetical protein
MVVPIRPPLGRGQGYDKDNPTQPGHVIRGGGDIEMQETSKTVKIWANTPPRAPTVPGQDMKGLCVFRLATILLRHEEVTLISLDGSTKIKDNGELSKLLHEDPNTLSKFFEMSLNKGRTMGEGYLSILGTIETSTTWTALINNPTIKKALDSNSINIFNTEFEDTDMRSASSRDASMND